MAAVFVGRCGAPGQDGASWRFVVANPLRVETIEGTVSGTRGGQYRIAGDERALEGEVEHIAGAATRVDPG